MEAALVLGVVFLTLMTVIKEAYVLHDTTTGSMILEETLEKAGYNRDDTRDEEYFTGLGEQMGNPRLWLGGYDVEMEIDTKRVSGAAKAGDWGLQMEFHRFRPEMFMRRLEALMEMGNGQDDSGSGV